MFTEVTECNTHPWANLQAKAEGFMMVYAKYRPENKTLEIWWPPEGQEEVIEGVPSLSAAKRRLASEVCETSAIAIKEHLYGPGSFWG